jgi:2-polyprenyl-3-methyl-5-hydroxy-6-metoxy-1,4-benzoquinol methylase
MEKESVQKSVKNFFHLYANRFQRIYKNDQKNLVEQFLDSQLRSSMFVRFKMVLDEIKISKAKTVLDVGCGPGEHDVILARELGIDVTGIDVAENMIELAKAASLGSNTLGLCRFILGSFTDFSSEEKFDLIFSLGVVEYIKEPSDFIMKMCNFTEGKVIFSIPVKFHWLTLQRILRYKIRNCPLWFYSKSDICTLMEKCCIRNYTIHDLGRDYLVVIKV